jgi:hypothetical protein
MTKAQLQFDKLCMYDPFYSKFTAYKSLDGSFYKCSFVRVKFLKWVLKAGAYEPSYDGNGDCNRDCLCETCVTESLTK